MTDPNEFIANLNDTRYLLFYPDIINKLCDMILFFNEQQINESKKIFKSLIDYMGVNPVNELINILKNSSNAVLSKQFPKSIFNCSFETKVKNNQIPPISEENKKNVISQSGIPFSSQQFLMLFNLISKEQLNILIGTLREYQIKELTKEKYIDIRLVGIF
jgi:hypothetical protein